MKSENDVKKEINKLLDKHRWFWWSTPMNGYGKTGISDKLAIRGGVLIAIEAKFGDNKPTVLQHAFLDSIRAEEGFAFVVNDTNFPWFQVFLEAFDRAISATNKNQTPTSEDGADMLNALRELTL